jgi:hypothetical protein
MAFLAGIGSAIGSAVSAFGPALQVAGTLFSAMGQIQAAQAQAQAQRMQARQAELQGRQNALQYNRQALQVFERQQRLAATARARAAAGGVDPFTGSPLTMQEVNALMAGREMQIAQENAQTALYGGLAESQSLRAVARATQSTGLTTALSGVVGGLYEMGRTATPQPTTYAPVVTATPTTVVQ